MIYHLSLESGRNDPGESVVNAIIRSSAIDCVKFVKETNSIIVLWKANAAEQIEAALNEAGWEIVSLQGKSGAAG